MSRDRREYFIVYRCRMCGLIYNAGGATCDIDHHMADIALNQTPMAPHIMPHDCDSSNKRGLADLT